MHEGSGFKQPYKRKNRHKWKSSLTNSSCQDNETVVHSTFHFNLHVFHYNWWKDFTNYSVTGQAFKFQVSPVTWQTSPSRVTSPPFVYCCGVCIREVFLQGLGGQWGTVLLLWCSCPAPLSLLGTRYRRLCGWKDHRSAWAIPKTHKEITSALTFDCVCSLVFIFVHTFPNCSKLVTF